MWWPILVLVLLAAGTIYFFNLFVRLNRLCDGAWADIDVQLKRRHDLVPNLVETVKDYKGFESETLQEVVKARTMAQSAQGPKQLGAAEELLTRQLHTLFAVWRCGAVVVPLFTAFGPSAIATRLDAASADLVVTGEHLDPLLDELVHRVRGPGEFERDAV